MDFGANQFGIHGATPTDLMHAFLKGVVKYIIHLVVDPMTPMDKAQLDYWIDHVFGHLKNSECKNFLQSNFTHGFMNLMQLTADEWARMIQMLLMAIHFQDGQETVSGRFATHEESIPDSPVHNIGPVVISSLTDLEEYLDEETEVDPVYIPLEEENLDSNHWEQELSGN